VLPQVLHPLPANLTALSGWLRITLSQSTSSPYLRIVSFNAVSVINHTTVTGELLGASTGEAGQTFQLRNTNIQPGTLDVAVQEGPANDSPLMPWTAGDLDSALPTDRKFNMDWEAGLITFGDGGRGMIPPAVPNLGRIVARAYAWGGGKAGNIQLGEIKSYSNQGLGITGIVNFVKGRGGKDAELLDDAKVRARQEISSRSRAVTAGDFKFIAEHTPHVEVALAEIIPLRVPLSSGAAFTSVSASNCGDPVPSNPDEPAGLADFEAAGAVSVVVVPREGGPEPTPTPSFLKAVCKHLDDHRLVTTEIHVVPPQYCRICNVILSVTARPGYTRAMLQDAVAQRLEAYLHVLHGGADGKGYRFGTQILAADLIAQTFRVEGVETVRDFECGFVRTKTDSPFREGKLMMCPSGEGEYAEVDLAPEETASVVPGAVSLSVV
jgi:predicted phage baseplate assembly protein